MKKIQWGLLIAFCVFTGCFIPLAPGDTIEEPGANHTEPYNVTYPGLDGFVNGTDNTTNEPIGPVTAPVPYVISPSELPLVIDSNFVSQHGNSFILGGDWTAPSNVVHGIRIKTPDVVLDGNNHRITGTNTNMGQYPTGVYVVKAQYDYGENATVKNIQVDGWYDGVDFYSQTKGRIENVHATNNLVGIDLQNSSNIVVTHNLLTANSRSGLSTFPGSNNNLIIGNTATGNKGGIGIDSNDNTVVDNIASDNTDLGILVFTGTNNTIENNQVLRNAIDGIEIWSDDNRIVRNIVRYNKGGIYLDGGSSNLVSENEVTDNSGSGISIFNAGTKPTRYNTISDNNVTGAGGSGSQSSTQNIGIFFVEGASNTIRGNNITGNNGGMYFDSSPDNIIYNNIFNNWVWNINFVGSNPGNTWSIARTAGPNIIFGPNIGGNFWTTPAGMGFSDTTPDSNGDGFCDSAFNVISNPDIPTGQYDLLPLHRYVPDYSADLPITNIWTSPGGAGIGVFRPPARQFILDANRDGAADMRYSYGLSTDIPLTADWNGSGNAGIGVYRPSIRQFILDFNRDGVVDQRITYGMSTDIPLTADWNGTGRAGIGVYRPSVQQFILDFNRDGVVDQRITYGMSTDIPLTADWNGSGNAGIGVYRPSVRQFILDFNRDGVVDQRITYGMSTDIPLTADWNGAGNAGIGVYRPSIRQFILDFNRDGSVDQRILFGINS